MKHCNNCNAQLDDDAFFCTNCGSQQPMPDFQEKTVNPSNNNEMNNMNHKFNLQTPQHSPKRPFPTRLISIIAISAITIIGIVAITTSCKHEWAAATCTEPQTCTLCGDTKGKSLGHDFINATCTSPKTCKICQTTEGEAIGHIESDWITTKTPTLISKGVEELKCATCGEQLNSRTTQKKTPCVVNDYFNFTDDELIDWINDISTTYVNHIDLGIFDEDSSNTSYRITLSDGDTGVLILNHGDNGKDGNIQAIMIYFDDNSASGALGIWLGNKIDSNFDTDDAVYKFVYNKSYTAANMTGVSLELDDDFEVYLLAPSEYVVDLLS